MGTFSDVIKNGSGDQDWAYDDIEYMAATGIVTGIGGGLFNPGADTTIAEFVKMAILSAGIPCPYGNGDWDYVGNSLYWSKNYIDFAGNNGFVPSSNPMAYQTYQSNTIIRQFAFYITWRAFTHENCPHKLTAKSGSFDELPFDDKNDVYDNNEWRSAIANLYYNGIVTGISDKILAPDGLLTRAQACAILHRCMRVANYSTAPRIFITNPNYAVDTKILDKMEEYYYSNAELKGWVDDGETCIFAFEGEGATDSAGAAGSVDNSTSIAYYHPNGAYNAMMVVTKGENITYVTKYASTLPDYPPNGGQTVKPGIYNYATGSHGGLYTGLRHTATGLTMWNGKPWKEHGNINSWYGTSPNFNDGSDGGYNIHCGYNNLQKGTETDPTTGAILKEFSRGCQLIKYTDYIKFGKAVGFLENKSGFTDLDKLNISSGTNTTNNLGNQYAKTVAVKYILDRTYLPDNMKNKFFP